MSGFLPQITEYRPQILNGGRPRGQTIPSGLGELRRLEVIDLNMQ
jgi:hypothetical protein